MAALSTSLDGSRNKGGAAAQSMVTAVRRDPPHVSPALQFYSLGHFSPSATQPAQKPTLTTEQSLNSFLKIRRHNAMPGVSATHGTRNLPIHSTEPHLELNVKPSLHDRFDKKFYLPGKYLNPFNQTCGRFGGRFVSDSEELNP